MGFWFFEHYIRGVRLSVSNTGPIYEADKEIIDKVLELERKRGGDVRLRTATEQDCTPDRQIVRLSPSCRDWTLGHQIEGNWTVTVLRNTSLDEVVQKADGMLNAPQLVSESVFFCPATAKQIAEHEAEQAEWETEQAKEVEKNRKAAVIGGRAGVILQIVLTVVFGWFGFTLLDSYSVISAILLLLAALSTLNLTWFLLRWTIYQVSFTVGRGFRDGKR